MNIRFAHVLAALTLITPSMLCASQRDAEACSVGPEPLSMPRARDASNMLPSNFITYLDPSAAKGEWVDEEGDVIVFEADDDPALPENLFISRPVSPLMPGQVISVKGCTGESCQWKIIEQDVTAPPAPKIVELSIYRDRRRLFEGPTAICDTGDGEEHTIDFALEFDEAIQVPEHHTIWVQYEREDGGALDDVPSYELASLESGSTYNADMTRVYFSDELSFENVLLRPNAPFCFRAALMDAAGNVSPWSELECVDPGKRRAPYMTGRGACSITPLGGASMPAPQAPLLGLLFGLVALGVRRRRA